MLLLCGLIFILNFSDNQYTFTFGGKGKSSDFYIYYKKSKGVTDSTGTIPDGFLEEAYFLDL